MPSKKKRAEETMSILDHLRKDIPEDDTPQATEPEIDPFDEEDEEELPLTKPKAAQKIF